MKYQSVETFEKHLKEAFPSQISFMYLLTIPCPKERRRTREKILAAIRGKNPGLELMVFDMAHVSVERALDSLYTVSLLGSVGVIVIENIEKLKKEGLEKLQNYVSKPAPLNYLILEGESAKAASSLYQKGKKELLVLDLSEEKPWEKKARIRASLVRLAQKAEKMILPDAVVYLMEHLGDDLPLLEQEVEKLICYVGERGRITLEDAKKLAISSEEEFTWQMAEKTVWEEDTVAGDITYEISSLLLFMGQIRYHLELGYKLASLVEKNTSLSQITASIHQIRSTQLEKYYRKIPQRPLPFFQKGLSLLFHCEVAVKSGHFSPKTSWQLFLSQLTHLKRTYARRFTSFA